MANEEGGKAAKTEKKKPRRATGPKPLYLVHAAKANEDGSPNILVLTRDVRAAMKALSENEGAKVQEHILG